MFSSKCSILIKGLEKSEHLDYKLRVFLQEMCFNNNLGWLENLEIYGNNDSENYRGFIKLQNHNCHDILGSLICKNWKGKVVCEAVHDYESVFDYHYGPVKLFVGHLGAHTSTSDLKELFKRFARVIKIE